MTLGTSNQTKLIVSEWPARQSTTDEAQNVPLGFRKRGQRERKRGTTGRERGDNVALQSKFNDFGQFDYRSVVLGQEFVSAADCYPNVPSPRSAVQ
jgi:hypothetical protein